MLLAMDDAEGRLRVCDEAEPMLSLERDVLRRGVSGGGGGCDVVEAAAVASSRDEEGDDSGFSPWRRGWATTTTVAPAEAPAPAVTGLVLSEPGRVLGLRRDDAAPVAAVLLLASIGPAAEPLPGVRAQQTQGKKGYPGWRPLGRRAGASRLCACLGRRRSWSETSI